MSVRVRIAPSPTGALHIGNVRTALYNYLIAQKKRGTFILRVEDTDQGRFVEGAEDYVREALKWLGIEPTEGQGYGGTHMPYRQSERKEIYYKYAQELLDLGLAYHAFDTESELEHMRDRLANEGVAAPKYDASVRLSMRNSLSMTQDETQAALDQKTPFVLRLKVEPNEQLGFLDTIREEVIFNSSELDDKVLIKADGMPTYHMANVIDDHLMKITHVIRGEEWISSTGHHLLLYRAFGWKAPQFAHLPLIMRPDGKGKLSKRDGAKFGIPVFPLSWHGKTEEDSFIGFREYGFEPEAVVNFLAFLGWNPGTDQELFSLQELAEEFDINKVHKSGARFDIDKARWYNQQYLRKMTNEELLKRLKPILNQQNIEASEDKLLPIINLYKERITFLKDLPIEADYFFKEPKDPVIDDLMKQWKPENKEKIFNFTRLLRAAPNFELNSFESFAKEKLKENGLKPGDVFPLYRLALSGSLQGPTVFQMIELMGSDGIDRILNRLEKFSTLLN